MLIRGMFGDNAQISQYWLFLNMPPAPKAQIRFNQLKSPDGGAQRIHSSDAGRRESIGHHPEVWSACTQTRPEKLKRLEPQAERTSGRPDRGA